MTFLHQWAMELWAILVESGVWLVGGFLLAGVVHVLLPQDFIAKALGGRGFGGVLKASLIGVPLPLCSCSVIPVAAGLRRDGASKGASASFAISTPESGADSIAFTWAVLGPVMGIARPIAALATALAAGSLVAATTEEEEPRATRGGEAAGASCCHGGAPQKKSTEENGSCCAHGGGGVYEGAEMDAVRSRNGLAAKAKEAARYGLYEMPKDLAVWLVVGLALSALIAAAAPDAWLSETIGTGLGPMLLMLVAGMPVYVCATASTPVAAALVAKGLSPGAALVFLLAGPATNLATMAWVAKDLGWRALGAYLAAIAVSSVAFGVALDAMISRGLFGGMTERFAEMGAGHEHGAAWWEVAFGVALVAMLAAALAGKAAGRFGGGAHRGHAHE